MLAKAFNIIENGYLNIWSPLNIVNGPVQSRKILMMGRSMSMCRREQIGEGSIGVHILQLLNCNVSY